jgi:NAD(P)-dependent dehydrogenase (short-subunit alcohol dehydrogenase family)
VIMLMRHIAHVYGPDGIRSVAICPGWSTRRSWSRSGMPSADQAATSFARRRRWGVSRRRRTWPRPSPSWPATRRRSSPARRS